MSSPHLHHSNKKLGAYPSTAFLPSVVYAAFYSKISYDKRPFSASQSKLRMECTKKYYPSGAFSCHHHICTTLTRNCPIPSAVYSEKKGHPLGVSFLFEFVASLFAVKAIHSAVGAYAHERQDSVAKELQTLGHELVLLIREVAKYIVYLVTAGKVATNAKA